MKNRTKWKRIIDVLMTLVLFGLMSYQYTGEQVHEIFGASMLILFLAHNFLNLGWYRSIGKGKYNGFRRVQTVVNLLLLADMLGMMVSGIVMSRYVFSFLPITGWQYEARTYHLAGSHWAFLLMSVHLGLHWGMVLNMGRKLEGKGNALRVIAFIIACAGVVSFFRQGFYLYLLLTNEFLIWDSERTYLTFLLQDISIMGTCIFATHYGMKYIQKKENQRRINR